MRGHRLNGVADYFRRIGPTLTSMDVSVGPTTIVLVVTLWAHVAIQHTLQDNSAMKVVR